MTADSSPPRNRVLLGDAVERMAVLPESSIDCIVTSPPYFRLRDYQVDGQLGVEGHVDQWVASLRRLMRQARRVLVSTGTVWLNLGDSYSMHQREGAPRKSLVAAPERLLLALIDDGWLVRNKIVWAKTNSIPNSVTDRLATTYEVIYLLARQQRYFFDLDEVRVPHRSPTRPPRSRRVSKPGLRLPHRGKPAWRGPNTDGDQGLKQLNAMGVPGHPLGKNPGDVWQLPTSQFRGAHFATYPEVLAARMIQAGVPEARCQQCYLPHRRPVRRLGATAVRLALRPTCECGAGQEPGLVLDPFMGSGTTAIAAERLGRDWLGIELNPTFVAMAEERIATARP